MHFKGFHYPLFSKTVKEHGIIQLNTIHDKVKRFSMNIVTTFLSEIIQ